MSRTKLRLMIDSSAEDERERAKLIDLHQFVVEQLMRLGIHEYVKVTFEYEGFGSGEPPDLIQTQEADARPSSRSALCLSGRQLQIAEMLCDHYSIKRIADELYVSVNTVKKHIQNIKKVLEIEVSGADFIYSLKQTLSGGAIHDERKWFNRIIDII